VAAKTEMDFFFEFVDIIGKIERNGRGKKKSITEFFDGNGSVQVIKIQGTRGMIIGHVNSTRVKHFVGTKLLRNTGNVSSAVTKNTMEVPAECDTE